MRDSINGLWLFSLMLTFIVLLIAFVSISLNYSKAYNLKTNMITVIEENEGFNDTSFNKINGLIRGSGYYKRGKCYIQKDSNGQAKNEYVLSVMDNDSGNIKKEETGNALYCVKLHKKVIQNYSTGTNVSNETKYYYTVNVYFGFALPVFGDLYTFTVSGETNAIYYPKTNEDLFFKKYPTLKN